MEFSPSSSAPSSLSSESAAAEELAPLAESLVAASQPFVGQWNHLVSNTNWQKGQIIAHWRESLIAQGVPVGEYSDEAWGRLVGGVTGQHVGRLRRVFQRFGGVHQQYAGLYWSHFQAALDWNDAEMWLEGSLANRWSVAQMREQRWETMGKLEADRPLADAESVATDEDFEPARSRQPVPGALTGEYDDVQAGPRGEGPDFGDEPQGASSRQSTVDDYDQSGAASAPLVRPFENLPELPDDLAEAFDAFKLAILRHKRDNWEQIAAADTLHALDALKALVVAPSSETAPF